MASGASSRSADSSSPRTARSENSPRPSAWAKKAQRSIPMASAIESRACRTSSSSRSATLEPLGDPVDAELRVACRGTLDLCTRARWRDHATPAVRRRPGTAAQGTPSPAHPRTTQNAAIDPPTMESRAAR